MQNYRFVGNQMEIGSRKLTKFGEVIALTPEQRKDAGPRAPLVHEALFTRVGFTDRKSTRLNSSHIPLSRMPSSA